MVLALGLWLASGTIGVRGQTSFTSFTFLGIDRVHLSYQAHNTLSGYMDNPRDPLNPQPCVLELVRVDAGNVETVLGSIGGPNGLLQGTNRQDHITPDTGFGFRLVGSLGDRAWLAEPTTRVPQHQISGTMLFDEAFSGNGYSNVQVTVAVPPGRSLTLDGLAGTTRVGGIGGVVYGPGWPVSGTGGSVRIAGCDLLCTSIACTNVTLASSYIHGEGASISAVALEVSDSVFPENSSQLSYVYDVILAADSSLRITDSEFYGNSSIAAGGETCSIRNCVLSGTPVISLATNREPTPVIRGNTICGLVTLTAGGMVLDDTSYLAGNYWGGRLGPWGSAPPPFWLLPYGMGNCPNYEPSYSVAATGLFTVSKRSEKRPFPKVTVLDRCLGQNVLASSVHSSSAPLIQGRDTLACYDVHCSAESLKADFHLNCNGTIIPPVGGASYTVRCDYGDPKGGPANASRTLNFIIPASLTETNRLDCTLYMNASNVTDYATPVSASVPVDWTEVAVQPHFGRKLRIGIMPVHLNWVFYAGGAPATDAASRAAKRLTQDLQNLWPLRAQDFEIVELPTYFYDVSIYGTMSRTVFLNFFGMNAAQGYTLPETEAPLDRIVALLPPGVLEVSAPGVNMGVAREVVIVDARQPDAILHELGHSLGLYTWTEQYDYSAGPDGRGNQMIKDCGAVVENVTAFLPETHTVNGIVPKRIRHFPGGNDQYVFDVMGATYNMFWIIPTTLADVYTGLRGLLGTRTGPNGGGPPLTPHDLFSPPAPGYRRVQFTGMLRYSGGDLHIIPESVICRDVSTSRIATFSDTALGAATAVERLRFFNTSGGGLDTFCYVFNYSSIGLTKGAGFSWRQVLDVPTNTFRYELHDSSVLWSANDLSQTITSALTVTGGPSLGSTVTMQWNGQGSFSSAPLTHQLYYSTNSLSAWVPIGGPQRAGSLQMSTDFLPAGTNLAFKVVSADGFGSSERVLAGFTMTNRPPLVTLLTPQTGMRSMTNTPWELAALARDLKDGVLSGGVWSSSIDGPLGSNAVLHGVVLSPGTHLLSYSVRDSAGLSAGTNITVTVSAMTNSDLRVPPDALNVRPVGLEPSIVNQGLAISATNHVILTVANQGVTNSATISLYLQTPGQPEQLLLQSTLTNWPPFETATLVTNVVATARGPYQFRAAITAMELSDPNLSNNQMSWVFTNQPPIAHNLYFSTQPGANFGLYLEAADPDGDPLTYTITAQPSLGTLAGGGTNWTYSNGGSAGSDTFRYAVSDGLLTSPEATVTIAVAPPAPKANFTYTLTAGGSPLTVIFTDTSTGDITNRLWWFSDGVTVTTNATSVSRTFINSDYTNALRLTLSCRLTVLGPLGGDVRTKAPIAITVTPPAPRAAFTFTPSVGAVPLTVTFNDTSIGIITNRSWQFGDLSPQTNAVATTVTHTYTSAGTFYPNLRVSGPLGSTTAPLACVCAIATDGLPAGDTAAPVLRVLTPLDYQVINTNMINVTGTVTDKNGIYNVLLNGFPLGVSGTNWSATMYGPLSVGTNILTFTAIDDSANLNTTTKVVHVIYSPTLSGFFLWISRDKQGFALSWPLWATNYVLQGAGGLYGPTTVWSNLGVSPVVDADALRVTLQPTNSHKFYRLIKR